LDRDYEVILDIHEHEEQEWSTCELNEAEDFVGFYADTTG